MIRIEGKAEVEKIAKSRLRDESRLQGSADALFFPENHDEAVRLVRQLISGKIPITVSSGRTGITGGAVPLEGVLVSFEKLDRIIGLEQNEDTGRIHLRAEAGVTLKSMNEFLSGYKFADGKKYMFPVDPTEPMACLGGMTAVNASGARSFRNGALRNHVYALTVILPDGEVLRLQRGMFLSVHGKIGFSSLRGKEYVLKTESLRPRISKDNAGYYLSEDMDLIDLFVGSEGTLGLITEVEVLLAERSPLEFPFMAFFRDEDSLISTVESLRLRSEILALEYFGPEALDLLRQKQEANPQVGLPLLNRVFTQALLVDVGIPSDALEKTLKMIGEILRKNHGDMNATWDGFEEKDESRLRLFRHLVPETINSIIAQVKTQYPQVIKLGTDLAVPDSAFREMMGFYRKTMEESGIPFVIFGHIGDSHVHVNILPRSPQEFLEGKRIVELFAQKAVDLGGTVSAEHGIGKLKRHLLELMFSPDELNHMRKLKDELDPDHLLNRGVLFNP